MIKANQIKPIPNYILKRIERADKNERKAHNGYTRFYAYFTKYGSELVKVTVACKNRGHKWFCKQVAVHGIHSEYCLVKDFECFMIRGYVVGWYEQGLTQYAKWWETHTWEEAKDNFFNVYAPILNKEYLNKFSEYRYSAVMQYPYLDVFKYLRSYEKYPQAEMLVKFGLAEFATSKQILQKVGKDKHFRKWLLNNREEIKPNIYYVSTLLLAYKTGKPLKETQAFEKVRKEFFRSDHYRRLKPLLCGNKDVDYFIRYIKKQNTSYTAYVDYLNACNYLGLDMNLEINRYPHDFRRWHDIRIDQYHTARALKDAEERKELYKQFASVAEKYMPLQRNKDNAFIVVIAKSPQDLIREGKALDHCVGRMGYDQKFAREESLIFFVRDKQTPDVPFVTVEYSLSQKKVLQCYGEHDHRPSQNVLEYVNDKWLPFANRQLKKIQAAA